MAEDQVSTSVLGVNEQGQTRSREGYTEVSEYSASIKAVANLMGDAAMDGGLVRNVVQDFTVLFNSLGQRGMAILAGTYDSIPDGIEVTDYTGRTLVFLSEGLARHEEIGENEAWALSKALTFLAQAVDDWALDWYGSELGPASDGRASCAN